MKSNCRFSVYFFFFKQKTAYEMRISDWSSDVCSSDLPAGGRVDRKGLHDGQYRGPRPAQREGGVRTGRCTRGLEHFPGAGGCARRVGRLRQLCAVPCRSEEHTSELQSLMRISYAVFCLKKKKIK